VIKLGGLKLGGLKLGGLKLGGLKLLACDITLRLEVGLFQGIVVL